jgi:hypothetical protein
MRSVRVRDYLAHMLLGVGVMAFIVVTGVAISIATDIHAIRMNSIQAAAELRSGMFSRLDSLKWNADTLITVISATNKTVSAALTQARVQEKHARDDQTADLKATSTAVVVAAEKTANTNAKVLEQIVAAKPVVNVETPKPADVIPPTIVVQPSIAAPVHISPAQITHVKKQQHGIWRWLRRHWPFGRDHGR